MEWRGIEGDIKVKVEEEETLEQRRRNILVKEGGKRDIGVEGRKHRKKWEI